MLYIFHFKINTLLCYTVVLVLGIGIARGQYHWILGALFGIVLTLMEGADSWCYTPLWSMQLMMVASFTASRIQLHPGLRSGCGRPQAGEVTKVRLRMSLKMHIRPTIGFGHNVLVEIRLWSNVCVLKPNVS